MTDSPPRLDTRSLAALRGVLPGTLSTSLSRARRTLRDGGDWPSGKVPQPSGYVPSGPWWDPADPDVQAWVAAPARAGRQPRPDHAAAVTLPCPTCRAAPGDRCLNWRDRPAPPHGRRVNAARHILQKEPTT